MMTPSKHNPNIGFPNSRMSLQPSPVVKVLPKPPYQVFIEYSLNRTIDRKNAVPIVVTYNLNQ